MKGHFMFKLILVFITCFSFLGAVAPDLLESSDLRKAKFQALYSEDEGGDPLAPKTLGSTVITKDVDLPPLDVFIQLKLESLFGVETKIFEKVIAGQKLIGYLRLHDYKGINRYWTRSDGLDITVEWELVLDWPVLGRRYSYLTSRMEVVRTMSSTPSYMLVSSTIQLGLGSGWYPPEDELPGSRLPSYLGGTSDSWYAKAARWLVGSGIESTFRFWGEKLNLVMKEKLGPILPKIDGEEQEFQVESVVHEDDTVFFTLSNLTLDMKQLLAPRLPEDMRERFTLKNIKTRKESITLVLEVSFLSAPSEIQVVAQDAAVDVSWDEVDAAQTYNLYYSTSPWMMPKEKITGVTSPTSITGLINGKTYYVAVTSVDEHGESAFSPSKTVVPQASE
jgi:hypothetical protein